MRIIFSWFFRDWHMQEYIDCEKIEYLILSFMIWEQFDENISSLRQNYLKHWSESTSSTKKKKFKNPLQ